MNTTRLLRMLWLVSFGLVVGLGCAGEDGVNGINGVDGADGADGQDGVDFPGPIPAEYTAADGIAGGAAYSEWWVDDAGGSGTQPTTTVAKDFYRCKACHAWDGQGNAASYANRTGQSTLNPNRPDVASVNLRATMLTRTYQGLFDLIKRVGARDIDAADNTHPDYSTELTDDQIWNIVKFMKEEWVAPNLLYDIEVSGPTMYVDYTVGPPVVVAPTVTYSNIGALGDETNGQAIIASICAACHGADGTSISIEGTYSLGQYLRLKPNEVWHKPKFGVPGNMDSGLVTDTGELQDLYAALSNATNFPDLP